MNAKQSAVIVTARHFVEMANEDSEQDENYWTPGTLAAYERFVRAVVDLDREPVRKGGGI